jgi:hypothetical protein
MSRRLVGWGLALSVALLVLASCAASRLARLDPLPSGEPWRGPAGSYELELPSDVWVRLEKNEREGNIDLSLARQSADAWLNVSLVEERFPTADLALAGARARMDSLLATVSRDEREIAVPTPDGEVEGWLGVYCGAFDREIRSRDTCFVILATVWKDTAYVLVGQVRVKDPEPGRQDELERLVGSLRLTAPLPLKAPERDIDDE